MESSLNIKLSNRLILLVAIRLNNFTVSKQPQIYADSFLEVIQFFMNINSNIRVPTLVHVKTRNQI